MATKTATGKTNTVANTKTEQENEQMETASENVNQFAQYQRDIKDSRKALRTHEKVVMDLIRQKAKPADVQAAIEKLAQMQDTLDHHKKALHDAKIGGNRENKVMCSWCNQKPAKKGSGFCSMKHEAAYGREQFRDYLLGFSETTPMHKHVLGDDFTM